MIVRTLSLSLLLGAAEAYAPHAAARAGAAPPPQCAAVGRPAVLPAVGRPAVLPAPALALRAALGEMANGLLLASARVQPVGLEDSGFSFRSPDLTSAIAELLSPDRPRS